MMQIIHLMIKAIFETLNYNIFTFLMMKLLNKKHQKQGSNELHELIFAVRIDFQELIFD